MCVIIAKPATIQAPNEEIITRAMMVNPDGFSIAWAKDGEIEIYKTMRASEMLKFYRKHKGEFDKCAFVFHARIATHGTKNINNCHGWKTEDGAECFFHNGILSITNREDMTDSETFFRDIYEPVRKAGGQEAAERATRAIIGDSKFAFLLRDGAIRLRGTYTLEKGVYYSNTRGIFYYIGRAKAYDYMTFG